MIHGATNASEKPNQLISLMVNLKSDKKCLSQASAKKRSIDKLKTEKIF